LNRESISQSTVIITTSYLEKTQLPIDSSDINTLFKSRISEFLPFRKGSLTVTTPGSVKHYEPFSSVVDVYVIVEVFFGQDLEVGACGFVTLGRRDHKDGKNER
jgi:hypothetical protein